MKLEAKHSTSGLQGARPGDTGLLSHTPGRLRQGYGDVSGLAGLRNDFKVSMGDLGRSCFKTDNQNRAGDVTEW